MTRHRPLVDTRVAITRPAGTGAALAMHVRRLGGTPILLPGSSLHAAADPPAARGALEIALGCNIVIFTSPAAVRFARQLAPLRTRACVLTPGGGTRQALQRAGLSNAMAPAREDSEGILALAALRDVRGRHIAIVGAPGGRGLLARALAARGAEILHAHVYQRRPARLDRRHAAALLRDRDRPLYVMLSSAEALANIVAQLPTQALGVLLAGTAAASSERLAAAARRAGFARQVRAPSPGPASMLAAVVADRTELSAASTRQMR